MYIFLEDFSWSLLALKKCMCSLNVTLERWKVAGQKMRNSSCQSEREQNWENSLQFLQDALLRDPLFSQQQSRQRYVCSILKGVLHERGRRRSVEHTRTTNAFVRSTLMLDFLKQRANKNVSVISDSLRRRYFASKIRKRTRPPFWKGWNESGKGQ